MRNHDDDRRIELSVQERLSFDRIAHELDPGLSEPRRPWRRIGGWIVSPLGLTALAVLALAALLITLGRTTVAVPFLCFVALVVVVDHLTRDPTVRDRTASVGRWADAPGGYRVSPPDEQRS